MPSNPISRVAKTTTQVYVDSDRPALLLRKLLRLQRLLHFGQFLEGLEKIPRPILKTPTNSFTPPRVDPIQVLPPSQDFQGGPGPRLHPVAFRIHASARVFLPIFYAVFGRFGKPPTTPNPPTALMAEGLMKTIGKLPE